MFIESSLETERTCNAHWKFVGNRTNLQCSLKDRWNWNRLVTFFGRPLSLLNEPWYDTPYDYLIILTYFQEHLPSSLFFFLLFLPTFTVFIFLGPGMQSRITVCSPLEFWRWLKWDVAENLKLSTSFENEMSFSPIWLILNSNWYSCKLTHICIGSLGLQWRAETCRFWYRTLTSVNNESYRM